MKTISEIRKSFWEAFPEYISDYRKTKRQNQYKADIRMAFVDYVDTLEKSGAIPQKLANKATL